MANVVLCSELGRGLRFLAKLADCATELQAQGHQVRVVCTDIARAHSLEEFKKISIFQAPQPAINDKIDSTLKPPKVHSYSSLLLQYSYSDAETLTPVLRGWLHLLATLDSDLVIADHAPTAVLASKLLMIPCVMMGSGFTVPPRKSPLPSISPWRKRRVSEEVLNSSLSREDEQLLATVNQSVKALNFDKIEFNEVQELYTHATQWVMSFAEIDHYGRREVEYVVRWSDTGSLSDPVWPDHDGDKVFVFMDADSPHLAVLLPQLKERDDAVLAVITDASDEFIEQYSAPNIRIQREPVNIRQVVEQCRVFINHCGHNMVYELLKIGVPSILLPNNPENTLLAYRVARRKLGFPGPAKPAKLEINALIDKVNNSDQIWANASRISMKYENNRSLARLHDLIAEQLPES